MDDWLLAHEGGRVCVTEFYNRVCNGYLRKFGFDLDADPSNCGPDPGDSEIEYPPSVEGLDDEEIARRQIVAADCRVVCLFIFVARYPLMTQFFLPFFFPFVVPFLLLLLPSSQRLRAWYLHHGQYVRRSATQTSVEALFTAITRTHFKKPKRMAPVLFYMREHFEVRVKQRYEEAWAQQKDDLLASLGPNATSEKKNGAQLKLRHAVAAAAFAEEDAEFKEKLKLDIEADLAEQKRAAAALQKLPETPQEFDRWVEIFSVSAVHLTALNRAFESIAVYLKAVCDGVAKRVGCAVSLFAAGPIPADGGACAVRSVHTGVTPGTRPQHWAQWDPVGYALVEDSMVRFANAVYRASVLLFIRTVLIRLHSGICTKRTCAAWYVRAVRSAPTSTRPCTPPRTQHGSIPSATA